MLSEPELEIVRIRLQKIYEIEVRQGNHYLQDQVEIPQEPAALRRIVLIVLQNLVNQLFTQHLI